MTCIKRLSVLKTYFGDFFRVAALDRFYCTNFLPMGSSTGFLSSDETYIINIHVHELEKNSKF